MQRWALLLRKKDPHGRGLSLDRIGVLLISRPHVVPGASRWDQPQTTFMIDFFFFVSMDPISMGSLLSCLFSLCFSLLFSRSLGMRFCG